jgi:acetyl-CoA acetyltransferase
VQTGVDRTANQPEDYVSARAARRAYEQAGIDPADVHIAEVHDATAMGELLNAEALMLVARGESGPAAERGEFSIGGRIPINTSGGLESKGHPIGATGLGQVYELVTQLRGEAGARQVANARIAIQENGGGLIGIEEAVSAVKGAVRKVAPVRAPQYTPKAFAQKVKGTIHSIREIATFDKTTKTKHLLNTRVLLL